MGEPTLIVVDGEILEEEWVPIREFPDYSISNYGRVASHITDRELKSRPSGWGYLQVILRRDNKSYTKTVHDLVAHEFINGWDHGLIADHINGDKMINGEWNLEWITRRENNIRALALGLRKPRGTAVRIVQTGEEFLSVKDCAAHLGTWPTNVSVVLTGNRPHYKGLTFEYV